MSEEKDITDRATDALGGCIVLVLMAFLAAPIGWLLVHWWHWWFPT